MHSTVAPSPGWIRRRGIGRDAAARSVSASARRWQKGAHRTILRERPGRLSLSPPPPLPSFVSVSLSSSVSLPPSRRGASTGRPDARKRNQKRNSRAWRSVYSRTARPSTASDEMGLGDTPVHPFVVPVRVLVVVDSPAAAERRKARQVNNGGYYDLRCARRGEGGGRERWLRGAPLDGAAGRGRWLRGAPLDGATWRRPYTSPADSCSSVSRLSRLPVVHRSGCVELRVFIFEFLFLSFVNCLLKNGIDYII